MICKKHVCPLTSLCNGTNIDRNRLLIKIPKIIRVFASLHCGINEAIALNDFTLKPLKSYSNLRWFELSPLSPSDVSERCLNLWSLLSDYVDISFPEYPVSVIEVHLLNYGLLYL